MIYGFLVFLLCCVGIFLSFIVLMQNGQGGFLTGQGGSDASMVFGGDAGSVILKKITWYLGFILIFGVFALALYKNSISQKSSLYTVHKGVGPAKNTALITEKKDLGKEDFADATSGNSTKKSVVEVH